jgi:hypothetical protein
MIEICAKLKKLLGIMLDVWYICFNRPNLLCIGEKKKKRCFICVTIVRYWPLQFSVLDLKNSYMCRLCSIFSL